MPHSVNRLTTDLPNVSNTIWFTTPSQPPSQDSENSPKLSMQNTGNEKENSPMKPKLPDLLLTSPTTSPAKVLPIPSRRTTIPALPRARTQLQNRRSPPLLTFLQNWGKME